MTEKITERLTTCIKHLAVSSLSSGTARIKSSCNLIENRFEMPNVSYTQPLMASGQDKPQQIFFENLDGLRFLCFLAVFFFHSFHTEFQEIKSDEYYTLIKKGIFGNGNLGVNFFFVLSGFLITYLLIKEKEIRHKINIPFFWMRRILRIWPLYFLCVFFWFFHIPTNQIFHGANTK